MTTMIAQCPSCLTEFELDPDKVPLTGLRARCSVCSAVIAIPAAGIAQRQGSARNTDAPASTTAHASTPAATSPAPALTPAPNPIPASSPAVPVDPSPLSEPVSAAVVERVAEPVADVLGVASGESASSAFAAPAVEAETITMTDSSLRADSVMFDTTKEVPRRRPVNPFLTKDPSLRAKRLARALVSDIVAYHPAKHAEGLRDGTLKTLFRDEIRKSYEEYVEQVGRPFAESTTHFQEALNDVLSGGRKQF